MTNSGILVEIDEVIVVFKHSDSYALLSIRKQIGTPSNGRNNTATVRGANCNNKVLVGAVFCSSRTQPCFLSEQTDCKPYSTVVHLRSLHFLLQRCWTHKGSSLSQCAVRTGLVAFRSTTSPPGNVIKVPCSKETWYFSWVGSNPPQWNSRQTHYKLSYTNYEYKLTAAIIQGRCLEQIQSRSLNSTGGLISNRNGRLVSKHVQSPESKKSIKLIKTQTKTQNYSHYAPNMNL